MGGITKGGRIHRLLHSKEFVLIDNDEVRYVPRFRTQGRIQAMSSLLNIGNNI